MKGGDGPMTDPRDETLPEDGAGADSAREMTELRELLSLLVTSSPLQIEFEIV